MWQLAAAMTAAIKYDATIYVNQDPITNHQNQPADYFQSIFKNIGIHQSVIPQVPFRTYHIPFMISTEAYTLDNLHFPIYFDQYYQYYPPIQPYESLIRTTFLTNLEPTRAKIIETYPDIHLYAFLHIRRGDFLQFQRHPVQPLEYYQTCMTDLNDKRANHTHKKTLVFSDDIRWVQDQPFFTTPPFENVSNEFVIIDTDEITTMAYMSLCRAGAICANSTFSWWGAFLGAHQTRSPVYVPRNWMLECRIDGLFPDEWIQI